MPMPSRRRSALAVSAAVAAAALLLSSARREVASGGRPPAPLGESSEPSPAEFSDSPPVAAEFSDPASEFGPEGLLCTASVDDGRVTTMSVLDDRGGYRLSLPEGHDADADVQVKCVKTEGGTGVDHVVGTRTDVGPAAPAFDGGIGTPCDGPVSFMPGYFDHSSEEWVSECTGRRSSYGVFPPAGARMGEDDCPIVRGRKDLWVNIVGDSVTRHTFLLDLQQATGMGTPREMKTVWAWLDGVRKLSNKSPRHADIRNHRYFLLRVDGDGYTVWMSYTQTWIDHETREFHYPVPRTWGEFVKLRGEGRARKVDPNFDEGRLPDVIVWSPGYHTTQLDAPEYGGAVDGILTAWRDGLLAECGATMPPVRLVLNMMPATWLVPDKYGWDRTRRSRLNEYLKNLAIIEAGRRHDFVTGVVDAFSVEMPYNGEWGSRGMDTAHSDAVHIRDERVNRVLADRLLEAICDHGDGAGEAVALVPPPTSAIGQTRGARGSRQ